MGIIRFLIGLILIASIMMPLNMVNAGEDDNPYTITSVPREMSYQGILRDSAGDPVEDSTYDITFRIFNVGTGGTSLWDETLPCSTSAGTFSATFSNVDLPFNEDYWLELEINSEILDPRQKMAMVGYAAVADTADYAQRVATVDGATGGTISGDVDIQSDLSVDGDINVTGKGTIGSGHSNTGANAFVAGLNNTASGDQSTVSGGSSNSAIGGGSTVSGGYAGMASGEDATIGGGWHNYASGSVATVAGGQEDTASGIYAAVGGGYRNVASGTESTVGGGGNNTASGSYSTVAGGKNNTADIIYSTVGGGYGNTAGDSSTVCGGINNTASNEYSSAICGGVDNQTYRRYSFIGGGSGNFTTWEWSVIGGGLSNTTNGARCTIAGGQANIAGGSIGWGTVGGGLSNTASGNYSFVGGGNTNTASGDYGSVAGGANNTAQGNYSFAAGRRAKANHNGSFVWGDQTNSDFTSTADDQFIVRASGGVGIGTNSPTSALDVNGEAKCEVGGVAYYMVPQGAIIMWSGTLANIPSGWALCDGTNGTPNLSDKFIYSVHSGENPGSVGGSPTIPDHNHEVDIPSFSTGTTGFTWLGAPLVGVSRIADYRHTHSVNPPVTVTTADGAESIIPPYYKLAFIMKL